MAKKELERRSYSFDISAEKTDGGNVIVGRPIVYSSRTNIGGMFDEIIEPGALDATDLKDVRFLVNHDTSKIPLARSRRNNGNSTMHLVTDSQGMMIQVELDVENNAEARSLYSAVQRGDISGMSFMFGVPDGGDDWENLDTDHPTRHIRSISSVVEVSAVTFPAYESTEIYARSKEALDNARSTLDKVRQPKANLVETRGNNELELLKEKTKFLTRFNPNHDGKGRFAPTHGGSGGSSNSTKISPDNIGASDLGAMSKEDRKKWLDDAPDGAQIHGLFSKRTDNEVIVRKEFQYKAVYGGIGAGTRIGGSVWKISGEETYTMAKTIRTAYEGTNPYYYIKK